LIFKSFLKRFCDFYLDKQREIVIEWINLKEQQRKLKETMFDFKNNLSETILK